MVGVLRASVVFKQLGSMFSWQILAKVTDDSHEDIWMKNSAEKKGIWRGSQCMNWDRNMSKKDLYVFISSYML